MKGKLWQFGLGVILAAVLLVPALVRADVFMKEKTHTDGMTIMGQAQPPQDKISTVWVTKDKMRTDHGDTSSIATVVDGKLVIYHVNHANKTYSELTVGSDGTQNVPPGMPGEMKVKITPTSETKKIGNWNCRKYLQEMDMGMMPINSEVWASEDIAMPHADFYEKLSSTMGGGQPGMGIASHGHDGRDEKDQGRSRAHYYQHDHDEEREYEVFAGVDSRSRKTQPRRARSIFLSDTPNRPPCRISADARCRESRSPSNNAGVTSMSDHQRTSLGAGLLSWKGHAQHLRRHTKARFVVCLPNFIVLKPHLVSLRLLKITRNREFVSSSTTTLLSCDFHLPLLITTELTLCLQLFRMADNVNGFNGAVILSSCCEER